MSIKKILIANRGEIAVRIIRACKDLGIKSVAIFSEIDRKSPHVLCADEAYNIGGAPSAESYLRMDKILDAAKQSKADAIHPGYGFLAENPDFAGAVRKNNLVFIGPTEKAISSMGDKTKAKALALKADVNVVPGTEAPVEDTKEAISIAKDIGFPVLIKAAAGGGGKGMRIVEKESELEEMFRTARSEAKASFGDDRVFIEKFISKPHHVEFQILADNHGNVIHLGERECSVQRRYQKVVEESPSPIITADLRQRMGDAAVRLVAEAGYTNAGTVEFLVDANLDYYFLEVNTRLQVEHPVTEMRTGIDLVAEQIRVASGEKLSLKQEDVKFNGHSIECRITAEDSLKNFAPATGHIASYIEPGGPGVRLDSGIRAGVDITPYYDPLLAKLVVWGATRSEAINRCKRALSEYIISGIPTSIPFCLKVLETDKFIAGNYDTSLATTLINSETEELQPEDRKAAAYAAAAYTLSGNSQNGGVNNNKEAISESNWKRLGRETSMR